MPDLRVASRLASFRFQEPVADLEKVARHSASAMSSRAACAAPGSRLRVIAELTDAVPGTQLWTKPTSAKVAGPLRRPGGDRAGHRGRDRWSAHSRGRRARRAPHPGEPGRLGPAAQGLPGLEPWLQPRGLDEAQQLLRRAVALDPKYGAPPMRPWACTSFSGWSIASANQPDAEKAEALAAAERAVELAPRDPTVLEYAGMVYHDTGHHEKAVNAERRCVEVAPFNLVAWALCAFALGWAGEEARDVEEAQAILDGLFESATRSSLGAVLAVVPGGGVRPAGPLRGVRRGGAPEPGAEPRLLPGPGGAGERARVPGQGRRGSGELEAGGERQPGLHPSLLRSAGPRDHGPEDRAEKHFGGLRAAGLISSEV